MPLNFGYPMFTGLAIAVPLTGRPLPPAFTWAYANLHPPMCYNVVYMTNFDQHRRVIPMKIDAARNWFAEQAVASEVRYLFFVDEDVTPPAHALRQLIFQAEHHEDGMVFGGVVCHKSKPAAPMLFRGNGKGPYWDWKVGEFFDVGGIGMGCTLIKTEVFSKIEKPWFKTVDNMDAFLDGDPKAETWTEDLYFCKKVTDAGYRIYADTSVLCEHWDMQTMEPTTLPADSFPMRRAVVKKGDKKIVDLGCGESPYETDEGEVLKVDIREEAKPDYRCDLRKLPFATGEFDVVFSSHTLEHFSREDVPKVLDEWIRVAKTEGELRLVLPNIEWAAREIAAGKMNNDVLNVLYGQQEYKENFHKFCFTPKVLEQMLRERGFKRQDYQLSGYNIYCRAWRVPPKQIKKIDMNGAKPGRSREIAAAAQAERSRPPLRRPKAPVAKRAS